MKKTAAVVALGLSVSACMTNGNPNALALGTLGAIAGGIGCLLYTSPSPRD